MAHLASSRPTSPSTSPFLYDFEADPRHDIHSSINMSVCISERTLPYKLNHNHSTRITPPKLTTPNIIVRVSLVAQMVKNLPAMQENQVQSLRQEDPLEKGIATYSSIRVWRIPWTEEPGGLQSMRLQRVGHDWATKHFLMLSKCQYSHFQLWHNYPFIVYLHFNPNKVYWSVCLLSFFGPSLLFHLLEETSCLSCCISLHLDFADCCPVV